MVYRERYTPLLIGVNSTVLLNVQSIGHMLPQTPGTITITRFNDDGTTTVIVNAVPVTAGVYLPLPYYLGKNGGSATTAAGASGTLGV